MGSVRATVDESGTVVSYSDYYPFGMQMDGRTHAENAKPTRENYTGHELDMESEMLYAGARYYDPVIARWSAADPMSDDYPGLSPYNYVLNNPVRLLDPDGKSPCCLPVPVGPTLPVVYKKSVALAATGAVVAGHLGNELLDIGSRALSKGQELLDSGAAFLGGENDILDYSSNFEQRLRGDFLSGYEIHEGPIESDMVLLHYNDADVPLGSPGHSGMYWTSPGTANSFTTMQEAMDNLAILPRWGDRTGVTLVRIPRGTNVTYARGHAAPQEDETGSAQGQGLQYLFKRFDPAWVTGTMRLPAGVGFVGRNDEDVMGGGGAGGDW